MFSTITVKDIKRRRHGQNKVSVKTFNNRCCCRDNITVVNDPFREKLAWCVCPDRSRDKFTMENICSGYNSMTVLKNLYIIIYNLCTYTQL